MKVVKTATAMAVIAAIALLAGETMSGQGSGMQPMMMKVDQPMVDKMLASWKMEPRELATKIIAKYGLPQEASAKPADLDE